MENLTSAATDLLRLCTPEVPRAPASLEVRFLDAAVAKDRQAWLNLWHEWPGREVMAHPDYVRLFARSEDRVLAAVARTRQGGILYPFIARPIALELWAPRGLEAWDTTTPYGYGGPFVWNSAPEETIDFWPQLAGWARREHVVTSFARLSVFPDQRLPFDGTVEINTPNLLRSLTCTEAELWADYESKVRKNVRRARERGCTLLVDTDGRCLDQFLGVYTATMERRNANSRYFLSRGFFDSLVRGLEKQFVFFHVLLAGRIISTELVLLSEQHAYSFLGGTLEEAFEARPNDFLKHESFLWCRGAGKKALVLGGAHRDAPGLLRYKSSFAPAGTVPFTVGKKTYDPALAGMLLERRQEWERNRGVKWPSEPDYFPPYRD